MKKQRWEESEKRRRKKIREEKESEERRWGRAKRKKSRENTVFPMLWGSGGSKSRLGKAAGAEPSGQMRDDKLQAVVARSNFRSQNVQNTPFSEHFWKLRCRKSARHCTPLWRSAHFEVKMYKAHQCRSTFGR